VIEFRVLRGALQRPNDQQKNYPGEELGVKDGQKLVIQNSGAEAFMASIDASIQCEL
jgi:hypothetical protein